MLILYIPLLFSVAHGDFLREIIRTEKGERYGALQCADARFVNDECELQGYLRDSDTGLGLTRKKRSKKPKFCLGKDGNKYKLGKGYVDQEACMTYKCVKNKKKLSMSGVPIPSCGINGGTGTTSTTITAISNTPGPTPTFKKNWLMTGKKIKTRKIIKSPTHFNCWAKCQANSECNFIMWMKKKKICTFFSKNEGGKVKSGFISGPVIILSTPAPSMGKPLVQATVDTCDDAGCKNAFNGLGMCVDTASAEWVNMSKTIDFTAGTKSGKCTKDCNCNCFKHTGCYSNKCDQLRGICLIPDQEEKRGFFIPDEYEKAFPCDESLNCHCFIKNYDGATRPSAAATEPPTALTHPTCPPMPACPTCSACPTTPPSTELPSSPGASTCPPPPECPSPSAGSTYPSTSGSSTEKASSYPSTIEGASESTAAANLSVIQATSTPPPTKCPACPSNSTPESSSCPPPPTMPTCPPPPECPSSSPAATLPTTSSQATGPVYFIAGGQGAFRDIELYHPTIEDLKCTITPPTLNNDWRHSKIFYHDNSKTIYLCGGAEGTKSICISHDKDKEGWKVHTLSSPRNYGHSTVVLENTLYIIGGDDGSSDYKLGAFSTPLPLTDKPVLTSVPNFSYKGRRQCVAKVDNNNLIVTGGYNNDYSHNAGYLSSVIQYNAKARTSTSLTSLKGARMIMDGCLVVEMDGKKYLIVTGGYDSSGYLQTTEMIDLEGNSHVSLGNLQTTRGYHGMIAAKVGVLVIGGYTNEITKTVEILDWTTKKWKKFEPSIKTARYAFGGVVEIDSSLFNCLGATTTTTSSPPTCPPTPTCPTSPVTPTPPTISTFTEKSCPACPTEIAIGTTASIIAGCSSDGQLIIVSNTEANIITSPGYPQTNYSANTFCDWTFQAPPGQKISFTLLELETEFGYDVLKLYDGAGGEEEKAPFLTTMSGTKIHDAVISSKEQMKVTFTADGSKNGRGFKASISAFNKEDLPRFDWLDDKNINVTFPNGKRESVKLKLSPNVRRSCVFHGKTDDTSLTISSSNTNSGCRSLTEDVEISMTSNNLEGKFGLFSLKNGKLTKTDETVFVSNSLNRQVRQMSKRSTGIILPKQIHITVNFGFDRGLLTKLGRYNQGKNFIESRIEEVFDHGKYMLQGISSDISIDLVFKSPVVFIDDILRMNQQDLDKCRQFQVDEQTPLIILIDDDYANHVKGLSFRSGACRNDTQRYGVTMVAWNDHSAVMGDVVYHEMGHMLGGIHDGGKSEHHSGLHLGHSEFNSQNVNDWFISAGYRCYGKTCTGPPPSPSHGSWECFSSLTSCQLICSPAYAPVISHTDCINGQWDTTNNHICAPTSSNTLYLLAGGDGTMKNVELYHPTLGSPSCKSPPPQLTQFYGSHTTFIHNSTIYLCGGIGSTVSTCISLTTGASTWSSHQLPSQVGYGLSSVVLEERIYFIGGRNSNGYASATYTTLPLSSNPTLTPVPNLSYKGPGPCVAKISSTTFVITGGSNNDKGGRLSTVILYDTKKESETLKASLSSPRSYHSCISLQEEEGKTWLIVTGGDDGNTLATTQRLDITANTWENLGDMKEERERHSMINSQRGIMVLGGYPKEIWDDILKSVELLVGKEWQKIEPSLAISRYQFGGAVEVPADFFNCQLDLKPGLGCPATHINTVDREDETVIENISTMEECSLECNKNLKCSYWTWFNGGQYNLNCSLMSNYGSTLSDSTAVTADRKCDLGCPTPPAQDQDNGAWTCNEANTICTLNCSPGYVSLHTEIKCSGGTWEDAESINCWKKKQPVEVEGCSGEYHYDEEYPGGEVVAVPEDMTCHGVCEERQDCVTWTWTNTTGCRLQTSLGTNQTKIGSISGVKNACKPVCYLVVEDEDEATSNTQYCPDPNQPTSCQNIIQMEASKYRETDEILICYEASGADQCADVPYEDVAKVCSDLPPIVSNSIHNRLRKRRFTRSNYATLSWG